LNYKLKTMRLLRRGPTEPLLFLVKLGDRDRFRSRLRVGAPHSSQLIFQTVLDLRELNYLSILEPHPHEANPNLSRAA
jgi:hypothetical protein